MTIESDWRELDGIPTAWFDASSTHGGAALAGRIVELPGVTAVDVRATGVRVRVGSGDAEAVSQAAANLGLTANPDVPQQLSVVVESANPDRISQFWQRVLGYEPGNGDVDLTDPLQRDPTLRIRQTRDRRPLRNRIHLDVVRPAALVEQVRPGEPFGPYGVCHADADGNEVDLVPGDPLGEGLATSDWQAVFSAMVCYRTSTPTQQSDLVTAAATLADKAGFPIMIDIRPGLVIIDSGKDQWDSDAHGLGLDFTELAGDLQSAAHACGATTDRRMPRFTQLFVDAADVEAVRAFWVAALGYSTDRREGVTDIYDSRRLNPVLVFQQLDASDTNRRRQRNRIHFELTVPADQAQARLATALGAGGRLLDESENRWLVADPEGNEMTIVG